MSSTIATRGLSHRFGTFQAVRGIDLNVPSGAVYGFLGPNGSGKTTTIRILLGLLRLQGGHVSILDRTMPIDRKGIARHVGSMVETPCLYDHLDGFDNIDMTRRALGLAKTETDRVLDLVDLSPFAFRRAGSYSLGMRQRLGIARALLGEPKLLILDEPMNGLDPAGIMDIRALIRDLPQRLGVTVFLSSHLLNEVEMVASHVGLMFHGELIAQSPLLDLRLAARHSLVVGVADAARAALRLEAAGIVCAETAADALDIPFSPAMRIDPAAVNALLVQSGFSVFSLRTHVPSLEDIFLRQTLASRPNQEARRVQPAH
jgi:ABC-type multidrug transport system ATPase subunit